MSELTPQEIKNVFSRASTLYTQAQVEASLEEMAAAIEQDLEEANPVVLCVLIGGVVLTGKLLTLLDFPLQVDYIHATRYGNKMKGEDLDALEWVVTPRLSLKGRTVLIVDDILDHGVTLAGIIEYCLKQGAASVKTAVLVEKQLQRPKSLTQKADFTGVKVENRWVFGYGMDYKGYLRNAPGIFMVAPEDES